eukprot:960757-Prymnesium_polylepis.1
MNNPQVEAAKQLAHVAAKRTAGSRPSGSCSFCCDQESALQTSRRRWLQQILSRASRRARRRQ